MIDEIQLFIKQIIALGGIDQAGFKNLLVKVNAVEPVFIRVKNVFFIIFIPENVFRLVDKRRNVLQLGRF